MKRNLNLSLIWERRKNSYSLEARARWCFFDRNSALWPDNNRIKARLGRSGKGNITNGGGSDLAMFYQKHKQNIIQNAAYESHYGLFHYNEK